MANAYLVNQNLHFTISYGRGHHDNNIGVIQGGTDATAPFYIRKIPRLVFFIYLFLLLFYSTDVRLHGYARSWYRYILKKKKKKKPIPAPH